MVDCCKNLKLTIELCENAVMNAFEKKWRRDTTLRLINKYGGVTREEIETEIKEGKLWARLEAVHGIACEVMQRVEDLVDGYADDLDLEPVKKTKRVDGLSMKERELTRESAMQQIFDHLAVLGLMPLFRAKILPWQFASIPGRGQTGGARQLHRWLNKKRPKTKHAEKVDVHHAFQSIHGDVIMALMREDIPRAFWQLALVGALLATDPDGALLIGSYLSAWLFNYVMSKFLRHLLDLRKSRRGEERKLVDRLLAYMDDVAVFADRLADLLMALKRGGKWLEKNLGLELKPERKTVTFLTVEEERSRRKATRPAARGCPGLDMMGYVVHRTYITIRPRVFLKARRQFLRAGRELEATGRIPRFRCYKLVSHYGPFKHSDSRRAQENLDVQNLVKIAKATIARTERYRTMKQKGVILP